MMTTKTALRLSAALLLGSMATPSLAQMSPGEWDRMIKQKSGETRKFHLEHDEFRAFKKIRAALDVKNYNGAAEALAKAVAYSEDAKYTFAALQLELGLATGDVPLQNRAVEAVLASGAASKLNRLKLERRDGLGAIWEADYDKAEATFREYLDRTPDKADALILLAETKYRANRHAEALALLEQAIALENAARRPIPSRWLRARAILIPKAREG